jgi:hypothetical protein
VIRGHCNYYGAPTNAQALVTFRRHVEQAWHRQLQRRSQRARWDVEKIKRFEARYQPQRQRFYLRKLIGCSCLVGARASGSRAPVEHATVPSKGLP